eukprot:gnl/TRDRNA2_/TRDRNA2_174444_c5_seq44.p1 gnl/TRDRNA2_/TRDRNA2_174444_c5~~gnl/TRDRNA2_/TRDRNA2_174444_c5_seq44.p1  ORF type:complete len:684 (+),score=255.16 gnl/TRDRNA2_/TRDRNA2_174444_c5_seq44:66-2117(+)
MAGCMKLAIFALVSCASSTSLDPIGQVLTMMADLEAKVVQEGEAEEKAYTEYARWCEDSTRDTRFSIKEATTAKEKSEATIAKMTADIETASASIAELAEAVAASEAELKKATEQRAKEAEEFAKVEAEMELGVTELEVAIKDISKTMGSSALLQEGAASKAAQKVIQSLSVVLDAASFDTYDRQKLLAMVQSQQGDEDDDADAPSAAAYESHSGGTMEILEDMKDKAETELADARKDESTAKHNFDMLKQSLRDGIMADNHEKEQAAETKTESEQTKATAEGELAEAEKNLAHANSVLETTSSECMTSAQDHEVSQKGRAEELAAIKKATEIIKESTGAAASFLQLKSGSKLSSRADLAKLEVVTAVKKLAKKEHSAALTQLASRISAAIRLGEKGGADVFEKVKTLITTMIAKLEKEAAEEADAKAYCDEETAKSDEKKEELTTDVDKLKAKIDQASTKSTSLKQKVVDLEKDLAELAKLQMEMDKTRADENAVYMSESADLEKGVKGIGAALTVLRDYYGSASLLQQPSPPVSHSASGDAGGSIISMLEVAESDFTKNLAQVNMEEEDAQADYDKTTQENKTTKTMKEQDAKYAAAEAKNLDKTVAELSSDLSGEQTELGAVLDYRAKLDEKCVKKPETYEERKERREAEIKGLKEAMTILEEEAAFLQRPRRFRHVMAH